MSNRFPTTNWSEFLMFLVIIFLIWLGVYGLLWGGVEIFEFLCGFWRH